MIPEDDFAALRRAYESARMVWELSGGTDFEAQLTMWHIEDRMLLAGEALPERGK